MVNGCAEANRRHGNQPGAANVAVIFGHFAAAVVSGAKGSAMTEKYWPKPEKDCSSNE